MLEKLLYKIVDFGRKHPSLRYVMLLPLAVIYLLDSILYYLSLPFRLIFVAFSNLRKEKIEILEVEDYLNKEQTPPKPKHRFRKALAVVVLLGLCAIYPISRYVKSMSRPMLITHFEALADDQLMIAQGSTIDELALPDTIQASGYALDKAGNQVGNEKSINLKISQWNVEPGFEAEAEAGVTYTFTPILSERFETEAPLPLIIRTVSSNYIESETVNEVYLNGKGSDANDGQSPLTAVQSFERAKELLNHEAGTIWIINGITIKDEQVWDADQPITLKRYMGSASYPAYTGTLIDIRSSGSLTLSQISIDGSSFESEAAAILVDGKLKITELTQIINNEYPDHAGAIDVGSKGFLEYPESLTFNGCSTDIHGSYISMQNGSSIISYTQAE